jgi:hypothetical protein
VPEPYPVEVPVAISQRYPVEVPVAVEEHLHQAYPVDPLLAFGNIPFPVGNPKHQISYAEPQPYSEFIDCLYPGQIPSAPLSGFFPSPSGNGLPIHHHGHYGHGH